MPNPSDAQERHSLKVGKQRDAREIVNERERNVKRAASGLTIEKRWNEFRSEYEELGTLRMRSVRSEDSMRGALDMFARLINPRFVQGIEPKTLRTYAVKR